MLHLAEKHGVIADRVSDISHVSDEMHSVEHVAEDFRSSEKHYLREENVLFLFWKNMDYRASFDNVDGTQLDKRQRETTSKSS